MNRRGFLKLLAVAPLALPAALKAIPPAARSLQQAMNELWVRLRQQDFVEELKSWAPRERCSRGQMVRVDSRCPSRYARWLEENAC